MADKTKEKAGGEELLYQLDGKPSLKYAIPIGLQHVFAMFTGNIAPLLIVTSLTGLATPVSQQEIVQMLQCAMLLSGIATLLQVFPIKIGKFQIGSGLPLVMGTSFAFVPIMTYVAGNYGIPAILGGALVGGIVGILMGVFIKPIKKLFPPIVVGSVLMVIGLNLLPTGANYFAGGGSIETNPNFGSGQNLILGFTVLIIITLINRFGKGMLKNLGILIGIAVGYIMAIVMGGIVDFSQVTSASWFELPAFMHFTPEFYLGPILRFAVIYIIVGLEIMGNMAGITNSTMNREPTSEEISGGIIGNSLTSMLGSLFGVFPSSAFGQNAGLVSVSKIINRFSIGVGGIIMVLIAFCPKIGAVFSAMPASVLGGAVISVFAIIFLNGVKLIAKAGFSQNNIQVLSLTLGVGYGLGTALKNVTTLPTVVHFILGEPVLLSCIVCILANILFNGKAALSGDDEPTPAAPVADSAAKKEEVK